MEGNSIKSFENLCKIFEMRIKLDREKNISTSSSVFDNYEKYSKKIDEIYNDEFTKNIKSLIAPAVSIEKEEERLNKLIKLLEDRLEKRQSLEDRYYETTGKYMSSLQPVVSDYELKEKKERLDLISRYLDTKEEIKNVTEDIAKLKNELSISEEQKEKYITKNKIMEDELYTIFTGVIKDEEYYHNLNEDDIDSELAKVFEKVSETKETLDVTKDSVSSLASNGLDDDYVTYVEDAEKGYYIWKNREFTLSIYALVVKLDDEFEEMYEKRKKILGFIYDRVKVREELKIDTIDEFYDFEKEVEEQLNILEAEKEVLENINTYMNRISFKEEKLNELEEINNSAEVLPILKEYNLIDTYEAPLELSTYDIPLDDEIEDAGSSDESVIKEFIDPYRIVEIKDYPKTLNIGLAKLKGESVREKVNKKLNPSMKVTFEDLAPRVEESKTTDVYEEESINNDFDENNIRIEEKEDSKETLSNDSILPVWEIPSSTLNESNDIDEDVQDSLDSTSSEVNNTLLWNDIKPVFTSNVEVKNNLDNNLVEINTNKQENNEVSSSSNNSNTFWIPVSDSKLESDQFPSINIPVQGNFSSDNDNFGFPSING